MLFYQQSALQVHVWRLFQISKEENRPGVQGAIAWNHAFVSVSRILTIDLGLETLDDEPEWQRQLKEKAGDREIEADVDPEDFSDLSRHEKRVADQARNRQPSGDQPGPEQQRTQEEGPESEHGLANLIGHGVRLNQE